MNLPDCKYRNMKNYWIICYSLLLLASCQKERDVIYQVNDETIHRDEAANENLKSSIEFISIVHTDLFGTTISQNDLDIISTAYLSFGDKKIIEQLIIKNLLNKPGVQLPTETQMRSDVATFVTNSYRKFFNRNPNEMEAWQLKKMIDDDSGITPEMVYYTFLTSNEYRYY